VLGDALLGLARAATADLLLVAPYIKVGALERVLNACPPACAVRVVTRWRAEELAQGVSDIGIWPILKERRAELFLHPRLHAKYYAAGQEVLIGSANLTQIALGWIANANLEILAESKRCQFSEFEQSLCASLVPVDDRLYELFLEKLAVFPPSAPAIPFPVPELDQKSFEQWRPALRHPEDLFLAYSGEIERLTSASRQAAVEDLAILDIGSGLDRAQFDSAICLMLRQHPEIIAIDALAVEPQRFGAFRSLLTRRGARNGGYAWQTWMRWLLYFFPDSYRMQEAAYSEIFSRVPAQQKAGWSNDHVSDRAGP